MFKSVTRGRVKKFTVEDVSLIFPVFVDTFSSYLIDIHS